jgi:hypothetical protein
MKLLTLDHILLTAHDTLFISHRSLADDWPSYDAYCRAATLAARVQAIIRRSRRPGMNTLADMLPALPIAEGRAIKRFLRLAKPAH